MKNFIKGVKNFAVNFWKADTNVKVRTIALIIALINLILYFCGKEQLNIEAETVWGYITTIVTVATSLCAWWKNNSITPEAKAADEVMRAAKQTEFEEVPEDEYITEDEV